MSAVPIPHTAALATEPLQTPAPDVDLFGPVPASAANDDAPAPVGQRSTMARIEGTLVHNAELRYRPTEHGLHSVPVLRVNLCHCGPADLHLRAELPFPEDQHQRAEATCATLKRGRRVAVTSSLRHMRLLLPHASAIELLPEPDPAPTAKAQAPTPAPAPAPIPATPATHDTAPAL